VDLRGALIYPRTQLQTIAAEGRRHLEGRDDEIEIDSMGRHRKSHA